MASPTRCGRPRQDEVAASGPRVVAVARAGPRRGRPPRSSRGGRWRASIRRCRSWTGSSGRCRAGGRRPRRLAAVGGPCQVADDLARRDHRRPARAAGQDPLLAGEAAGHRERVAIADADPAVDDRRVVGAREEVLADALGQVRAGRVAGQDAALGIGADDLDRRVARLEDAGGAGDRAAGPDAGHEMGDPALGLVPQLGAGRPFVRRRVLHVPVLVGLEGARDVTRQPRRDRVVALRRFGRDVGRAEDDLRAVCAQELLLLGRLLVGHDEDAAVALERGGDGQAVAGVARCRLDDRAARLEQAGRSAASIIGSPMRSLTEPPGLSISSLASRSGCRSAGRGRA